MRKKSSRSPLHSTKSRRSAPTKSPNRTTSKVRIIGGRFKRRQLAFIDAEGLRPTPDRLRETLFNWLMADIIGAQVLDCCAGSGVLGFEALSRGADRCTFIEANPQQYQKLIDSARQLELSDEAVSIVYGRAEAIIPQYANKLGSADIIFLDPPYDLKLWRPILHALIDHKIVNTATLIYIEADRPIDDIITPLEADSPPLALTAIKQKKVGQIFAGLYQLEDST